MEFVSKTTQKNKRRDGKHQSIYSRALITRNIVLPITAIGKNIKETIEQNIKASFEGKCIVEGYIKENSSKIITYSSGLITNGYLISFEVVFECEICFPVEGMLIYCIAKNITKAGIRAESYNDSPSPIVVFVAKDHHFNSAHFADVKEGDKIIVRVIGQRFELNDKYISIIGELVKEKEPFVKKQIIQSKPKIVIEN
jgi:DNA-directed RNA polymerase subunit E'/Rpb7